MVKPPDRFNYSTNPKESYRQFGGGRPETLKEAERRAYEETKRQLAFQRAIENGTQAAITEDEKRRSAQEEYRRHGIRGNTPQTPQQSGTSKENQAAEIAIALAKKGAIVTSNLIKRFAHSYLNHLRQNNGTSGNSTPTLHDPNNYQEPENVIDVEWKDVPSN